MDFEGALNQLRLSRIKQRLDQLGQSAARLTPEEKLEYPRLLQEAEQLRRRIGASVASL